MGLGRDRVLFIAPGAIGDAILSSGALSRFVEREPQARFTIAASPASQGLFVDTPRLDDLIVIVKQRYERHWFDLWRRVGTRRWRAVIDMRGSGLAYALWAGRRFVWSPAARAPDAPPPHKVLEAARTIRALDDPPSPYLYTSAVTEARADALVVPGGPVLALAPATSWPPKTWPAERFAAVAVALLGPGGPLEGGRALVTGAKGDEEACAPIYAALPRSRIIDRVGSDLLTTYACLKRCRLFIGNDTGPMHLAAAAGVPTLGLFGPSDERRYGPWGLRATVARGARSYDEAIARLSAHGWAINGMTDLSVANVVAAAHALLERTAAASPHATSAPLADAALAPENAVASRAEGRPTRQ